MTLFFQFVYELGIHFYRIAISFAGRFNLKAKLRASGENNWKNLPANKAPLAWFHCASLGEFEQGRPVLEAFKAKYPEYKILLTFFSPSGYEVRKNYSLAEYITYLPLDTRSNAQAFIDHFRPSIAFFVKYEFWRNFAFELQKRDIPLLSFSTIFRKNQIYFKPFGGFSRQTLRAFNHFFVQNSESADLLQSIAIENTTIAGDTRYDRVQNTKISIKPIPIIEQFVEKADVVVVGSAWQEDMEVIIEIINDPNFATKKYIIAPHEINAQEIDKWSNQIKLTSQRYSTFNTNLDSQVLFIDNVGMLSAIYQYAYVAYIGGSFGKGLHNILEASVFGIPVFFGNKGYHKFQEANELIALGSATAIANSSELKKGLLSLENQSLRNAIYTKNATFIKHHLGASKKVLDYCETLLPQ